MSPPARSAAQASSKTAKDLFPEVQRDLGMVARKIDQLGDLSSGPDYQMVMDLLGKVSQALERWQIEDQK